MLTGVVNAVLLGGLVVCLIWALVRSIRHAQPTDYWTRYIEELQEQKKWFDCQESEEGCQWPDHCTPGNCRKAE